MVKNHLKTLNSPTTWDVNRKSTVFTTRPNPGPQKLYMGLSIRQIIVNEIGIADTLKEVKQLINNKSCYVNGNPIKDARFHAGFMDVVSFPELKEYYRIVLSEKGKLKLIKIDEKEAKLKLSVVTGKSLLKGGKVQINTNDALNLLVDQKTSNDYKVGDSLLVELPSKKIKKIINFAKDSYIVLTGGKHIGSVGQIEDVDGERIMFKGDDDQSYKTLKKYLFIIGEKKPEITINEKKSENKSENNSEAKK